MSDTIPSSEQASVTSPDSSLDSFHPLNYPALALQTYESFGGDPNRVGAKADFSSGKSTHLAMEYPKLKNIKQFDQTTDELNERLAVAIATFGEDSVTVSSIRYRLEEVEFLKIAHKLNNPGSAEERQESAEKFVELGERLYGIPDQELADSILGTLKQQSDLTNPYISELWRQVEEGFSVTLLNGENVAIGGVDIPQDFVELPKLTKDAEIMLAKEWRLFKGTLAEAQALIADIIAVEQGMEIGYDKSEIVFSGKRLYDAFVLGALGLAETMEIDQFNVVLDPNGSAASWESGQQAIVIGANRSATMGATSRVTGTMPHEATHAIKSVQGALSGEPALSTGVFTIDDDGNWVSYLDYEEGNNKLGESLVKGDDSAVLNNTEYHEYTIMSALAYRGFDDRQIKEIMAKISTAVTLSTNQGIDLDKMERVIKNDFTFEVERLFRGTPCDPKLRVDGHMPIFTKDTAYDRGELTKAIPYWNRIVEEALSTPNPQVYLHNEFIRQNKGKIDPSDSSQTSLIA